jgi:alpha-galactosidase
MFVKISLRKVICLFALIFLSAYSTLKAQNIVTDNTAAILTPKAGPEPHINGPKIFGVRPGHPLLYTIPASGDKPVKFLANKLPKGIKLDGATGQLSGIINQPGTYEVTLHARNKAGKTERPIKIVVGETIALTPPMGWNSWNIYASKITQELLLANAKAMVSTRLIDHGWSYMNIDDVWQGKRGGEFNAIQPNPETFPDMQKAMGAVVRRAYRRIGRESGGHI